MAQIQKHPLRALNKQEERELHRLVKATSERLDVEHRAKDCWLFMVGSLLPKRPIRPA